MSPEQEQIVAFLRGRYAEAAEIAQSVGLGLIYHASNGGQLTADEAKEQAVRKTHAAQTRIRFFEETVVPYLGTAGPTGRIAEQQLRMLAWEYEAHPDYEPGWAP